MIAYSEALQHLLDAATPLPAERLPLQGRGRRWPVTSSAQSLPPFDNSAMDGFALRANGTAFETGTVRWGGRRPAMPVPTAARVPGKS